jgi:3'(2'), 5'-bisphosphate nucleotidase
MKTERFLPEVVKIAQQAGEIILQYYQQDTMGITHKADNSPLTLADQGAHDFIVQALNQLDSAIPVLSEESADIPWETRQTWPMYWLCDPLDGTREFIQGKPEFTVNIALIANNQPILGVIYAPALKRAYFAANNNKAYRQDENAMPEEIKISRQEKPLVWRAIGSHSKPDAVGDEFLARLAPYDWTNMGSALKFCLVAEGSYDIYPRFVPSMEWDTAAGQCIVEAAGGKVIAISGTSLDYNKQDSLKNTSFIVCARCDNFHA